MAASTASLIIPPKRARPRRRRKKLHRIDKNLVIQEVTGVGFRLEKEGEMLRRLDDTRDFITIKIRNKSDRFVLKFVKP